MNPRHSCPVLILVLVLAVPLSAWDYEGHRTVNRLALASLPEDFPAFAREAAAAERIAFLSGEPDRWRNVSDLPLRHCNASDHYMDLEGLEEMDLTPAGLTEFRHVFTGKLFVARELHPEKFPAIDPTKNQERTRELVGFLPWAITEHYGKLRSAFSYLKALREGGTAGEIANAEANVIYLMGVMGHFVGDAAQPLHTTKHHNGWVGENPAAYSTWNGLHAWIDGGFMAKVGLNFEEVRPLVRPATAIPVAARADGRDAMFVAVMDYLMAQHAEVVPLYELDKAGAFTPEGAEVGKGRAFINGQLLKAGGMLGRIWLTAWRNAGPDTYLRAQLLKRRTAAGESPP